MRLNTPIKPALALGSNRVVVIATESAKYGPRHTRESPKRPDLDDAILQFFQGTLADRLIEDVYRLGRTNAFIAECARGPQATPALGMRTSPPKRSDQRHVIGYLLVGPETPTKLGDLAKRVDLSTFSSLRVAKWLAGAQGSTNSGATDSGQHRELLSYAMFHRDFHVEAISLGECDATRELDAVGRQHGDWRTEPLKE
jgi:NTE family protein